MRANPPMSAAEIQAAAEMLDEGTSYGVVARILGRDIKTIRRHLPGRSKWRYTYEHDEPVRLLTLAGRNSAQIAVQLGITQRTVQRARNRTGVARPKNPLMTEGELLRAKELLKDGAPYTEVARTLGRSADTISDHFPGYGWGRASGAAFRHMMTALDDIHAPGVAS